jgi:hypothetical protein
MSVYGDDPLTGGVAEGCAPGEEILLVLWSNGAGKEYHAVMDNATGDPARLVWTGDGGALSRSLDFVEGNRVPLRNGAWNLVSHGVLTGYHKGAVPSTPQLPGVSWVPVASIGEAVPLKSIAGRYDRVISDDGTGSKYWNPANPLFATLNHISPGYGCWVKMKPPADGQPLSWMTVPGIPASGDESLPQGSAGWRLLGYWGNGVTYHKSGYDASGELLPLTSTDNVSLPSMELLWESVAGQYERTLTFDGTGAHTLNPALPAFTTVRYLGPGYGYWIKMKGPGTISYPAGTR